MDNAKGSEMKKQSPLDREVWNLSLLDEKTHLILNVFQSLFWVTRWLNYTPSKQCATFNGFVEETCWLG